MTTTSRAVCLNRISMIGYIEAFITRLPGLNIFNKPF